MKDNLKKKIKTVGAVLFVLYIFALVYFLFFSEGYGRGNSAEHVYRYNLVPFREIRRFWVYRQKLGIVATFSNLAGNIIGFIPFGLFLPLLRRNTRNLFFIGAAGLMVSLIVECIQLVSKVGCFDVDDLILNTLGAIIGYMIFCICNAVYKRIRR